MSGNANLTEMTVWLTLDWLAARIQQEEPDAELAQAAVDGLKVLLWINGIEEAWVLSTQPDSGRVVELVVDKDGPRFYVYAVESEPTEVTQVTAETAPLVRDFWGGLVAAVIEAIEKRGQGKQDCATAG